MSCPRCNSCLYLSNYYCPTCGFKAKDTPKLEQCPKSCNHETFHYCVNGTHCDKHCVCKCYMCKAEQFNVMVTQMIEKPIEGLLYMWHLTRVNKKAVSYGENSDVVVIAYTEKVARDLCMTCCGNECSGIMHNEHECYWTTENVKAERIGLGSGEPRVVVVSNTGM